MNENVLFHFLVVLIIYVCSMGLCFPFCLFGRIYEKAQFGKCWAGCCKLFTLQILINSFLYTISYSMEWNMFLQKELEFTNELHDCIQIKSNLSNEL